MKKIEKLKKFLQENFPNVQAFNTCSILPDRKYTVYYVDNIRVDYAPDYDYIEIFGLTQKQFDDLLDPNSYFGDRLKTFEEYS